MEVVAAISSIAGIVALTGQILSGIVTLQGVFDAFSQASRTITKFVSALKSLLDSVQDVKDLVLKLERANTLIAKSILLSLQIQLEDCLKDVDQWVKVAGSSQPKSGKPSSFDTVLKKFLVALKKDSFDGIFKEIADHKDNISIKLSVIGRHLNIQHTSHLRSIESKIVETHSITKASHQITADALQRLESQLSGTDGSPCPSLRSLADQMSDIQSLLRSQSSVGSAPSVSARSMLESRKASAIYPGHASPGRPSVTSNASSVGSRRTSQFGKTSHLPVRRKSSLGLAQIDSQIMPRVSRTFQDPSSPIPEYPGIPTLSITSGHTSQGTVYSCEKPRRPIDALQASKKLLDVAKGICPPSLLAYMELVRVAETISMHTKLLTCIQKFQDPDSLDLMETKEYQDVYLKLQSLRVELDETRQICWREGLDMADVDKVLSSGYGQDPPPPLADDLEQGKEEIREDVLVLRRQLQRLRAEQSWTSKLDRTNAWLLENLASSDEAVALHRSYIPNSEMLDEKHWARLVLKYWLLDEAGAPSRLRSPSTIGAMMDGMCHSIKVRLDMRQEDWESLVSDAEAEVEENAKEKCFDICSESGWKRGTLYKQQQVTITVTEVTAMVV